MVSRVAMVVARLFEGMVEAEVMSRMMMVLLQSLDIAVRIVVGVGMLAVPLLTPLVSETEVDW
jgi:hypothetical protein